MIGIRPGANMPAWVAVALLPGLLSVACRDPREDPGDAPPPPVVVVPSASPPQVDVLYLPDGGDRAPPDVRRPDRPVVARPTHRCPPEMVSIRDVFCIDRHEAVLEDSQGRQLSPYYHPTRTQTQRSFALWESKRHESATAEGRALPVPPPPAWQLAENFEPRAVSRPGVIPHGYQSGATAALACSNAGKRVCTREEWVTACRGEADTQFPYGNEYEHGRCNVFRATHPAAVLHDNPSIHHLDPRLNRVTEKGHPLLRPTGATADCRSRWGDDAVHDLVGNLAEWVADSDGVFVGGFYARDSRDGCDRKVTGHAFSYFDYSLGIRCCK